MRCYYHENKEAVGTCKSCGKGLCRECAVDLGKGLACRGRCETDAQAVIQLIDRNIHLSITATNYTLATRIVRSSTAIFNFFIGGIFIVWSLTDFDRFKFLLVLGIGFIVYGSYWLLLARKISKAKETKNAT
jgi:hypothetical protein